jgi:multicomponent Na+:H+ antiporter subunit D
LEEGLAWIVVVISFVSAITGAAVFRVAARVFLGWGPLPTSVGDASRDEEDEEAESAGGGRSPAVMVLPTILFLVAALGLGLVPGIEKVAERAGERFTDRDVYQRAVLAEPPVSNSERVEADPIGLPARPNPRPQGALVGTVATLLALLIAYAALSPRSFPATLRHLARDTTPFFEMMRKAHSGHVGDYVAWLSAGVAALGAIFVTALL